MSPRKEKPTRLWGGRFESEPAPELIAFTRSAHVDWRLGEQDCRVLSAHAHALAGAGVLTAEEASRAASLLGEIGGEISRGSFQVSMHDEDVHSTVERAFDERDAALAAKLRAGLSRNDRVATAFRLWIAGASRGLVDLTEKLAATLEERGGEHRDTIMPGYTHMQRAQAVTLGYHLSAHVAAVRRAADRLERAEHSAMSACPLGAGALAGTTLNLDRAATAASLGFDGPAPNMLDAVADRDFVAELLFAAAMLGITVSRLAEEIVLWTTSEFGFAVLDDSWATGSSLMPQKRNPDIAELSRGKAGRLLGDLTSVLTVLKGLPLTYNRDLQEDKEPVFHAVDTLALMLPAMTGLVATLRFDTARLRAAADDGTLLATDLAEYLVGRGIPFRDAHEAVGKAVRRAVELGVDLAALGLKELQAAHAAFDEDVTQVLNVEKSVRKRLGPS